jgi:NAD-dependent deacetylase
MAGGDDPRLEELAQLLREARHALVLTGAGVSTESGLPDYRGSQGLWGTRRFEELAHIETWRREPEEFWDFYGRRLSLLGDARPNPGHVAIAELERLGFLRRVLTQNVDGLHRAAGSRDPLELHGTLAEVECPACSFRGPCEAATSQLAAGAPVPLCPDCGRNLKPAVVLFGEMLPPSLQEAHEELAHCDLIVCCGSSLQVYPVAAIPERVLARGGAVAVVNIGPTGADHVARVRLDAKTGEALPAIVELLRASAR